MKILIAACAAGALLSASNTGPEDATGAVAGKAVLDGKAPEKKPDFTPKEDELKGCHHEGHAMDMKDRSLIVDDKGGIANVVVMIEVKGHEKKLREEPVVMDQVACRFEPHVQVLHVGETIRYDNSDETNHNIHTYARKNTNINNNIAGGSHYDMKLEKEETFEIKCDIHPWMNSWLVVTEATHVAISKPDGSFEIKDLPPGEYKAEWWHETLGKGKETVTVTEGGTATLDLKIKAEKKKKGGRRR